MQADEAKNEPTPEPGKEGTAPPPGRKLALEFLPLVIFFGTYKYAGIFWATGVFMVAMTIAMAFSWHFERHISTMQKVTFLIVAVMGGLTLYLQDATFVKMKPTIVYSLFAIILVTGLLRGRSYLRLVMEAGFPAIEDRGWMMMTRNWALFFSCLAIVNELVWRNLSEDTWVTLKVWGLLPLTLLFALLQLPIIMKYQIADSDNSEK